MKNPFVVQVFETFQCHDYVGFNVCWTELHIGILDYHFQVGLHEVKDERDFRYMAKNIQKLNDHNSSIVNFAID